MRFWISDIDNRKVVRAPKVGIGAHVELATADGWQAGSTELAYKVMGGAMNMDWDEVTPAAAHAALAAAGLDKAAADMG